MVLYIQVRQAGLSSMNLRHLLWVRKGGKDWGKVYRLESWKVCFGKCTCFSFTSTPQRPLMHCRRNRNTENTWSQTEHTLLPRAAKNNSDCNTLKTLTTEDGKWRKANETQSSTRRQICHVDKWNKDTHKIKEDHKERVHQTTCMSVKKQAKDSTGRQWRWFQLFKNQNKIGWSLNKILRYWIKIAKQRYSRKPL